MHSTSRFWLDVPAVALVPNLRQKDHSRRDASRRLSLKNGELASTLRYFVLSRRT
jgi:hypothetical protein